jgi:hypothetical protein
MPSALQACMQLVEGCAAAFAIDFPMSQSGLFLSTGIGAGALGIWAVICWLTPSCYAQTEHVIAKAKERDLKMESTYSFAYEMQVRFNVGGMALFRRRPGEIDDGIHPGVSEPR